MNWRTQIAISYFLKEVLPGPAIVIATTIFITDCNKPCAELENYNLKEMADRVNKYIEDKNFFDKVYNLTEGGEENE